MRKFIYTLLALPLIFSCGEDLKPDPSGEVTDNFKKDKSKEELSQKKEIKTITWDQTKEYGELKEDAFLKAQTISDFKKEDVSNEAERNSMLDVLRSELYKEFKQFFTFKVYHFKVSNNYAWFIGDAKRKDGNEIIFPDEFYDCCHVEALFRKNNGKWQLLESGAFSSDVWFDGIWDDYKDAPRAIFD